MEQMRHDLDMALLLAVVDEGGFSAAARAIGQTHSAVSKRVSQLEERLGAQLLIRTTRSMRLTQAGERYVAEAREIMARITVLESEISDGSAKLQGKIRLTTSNAFGQMHVVPAIVDFMKQHPEIEVDLTLTDAVVDIVRGNFDLAVRNAALPDSSLVAVKLLTNRRIVCASPEYVRRRGTPAVPEDLINHACLRLNVSSAFNEWGLKSQGATRFQLGRGFACNSIEALHAACLASLGIAWLPMFLVGADLEAGKLSPLLDEYRDVSTDSMISVIRPAGDIVPARIRTLTDFFVDRFRASIL
ncbi:LysR family transcriptional regulator [Planktotalea sp.]|uniref:LysR family transcriptional regulator n=2 Tax=Rhodobacterales TaxID=204455 RepID=UPI003297A0E3